MNSTLDEIYILLVENNKKDRELLTKTLSKYFKNIIEAENTEEAFKLFKENKKIDIIISDMNLPKLNGIEFLKLVRMLDLYLPFIITTEQSDPELLIKAIDLNVSSLLLKPLDISKLLEKIDILCEKKFMQNKLDFKQKEIENYIEAVNKVSLIFKMSEDGNISYMNESMRLVSKYEKNEIKKLNFNDIIHPDIPKKYIEETWEKVKHGELWEGNTKFISKDNEVFYLNNSIFKIENFEKEEYITIAFLNTKENLKKRDFQRKVLLSIKDANKKEYELKNTIKTLNQKIKSYEKTNDNQNSTFNKTLEKLESKEKRIQFLEKEILESNSKFDSMLKKKRDELEMHINTAQKYKIEIDKQKEDIKKKEEQLDILEKRNTSLKEDISKKDILIKELQYILNESETNDSEFYNI